MVTPQWESFTGKPIYVTSFTHLGHSNHLVGCVSKGRDPILGLWGVMERLNFFHKMVTCVLPFLNSIDLGIAVLKLETQGKIKKLSAKEHLLQTTKSFSISQLLHWGSWKTQVGWRPSAPHTDSALSWAAFLLKEFLMCSKMFFQTQVLHCPGQLQSIWNVAGSNWDVSSV